MKHVLVHGASIGELLAAETVVAGLRDRHPDLRVTYSYTSRSVARWPSWPADAVERLPFPTATRLTPWLRGLDPDALLLSRGDLWPGLLRAAARGGIPAIVIGGRIGAESRRLRWPWRLGYRRAAAGLAWVGAVTEEDASRWVRLGVPRERVTVTGDPAVDRLLAYRPRQAIVDAIRTWAKGEPVLVVGSMEPSDRAAVAALLAQTPRALIVPHDPERLRLPWPAWSGDGPLPEASHVAAPRRGILLDCYHAAAAAYVGGGHTGRLHSVLEPVAAGVPVVQGPEDRDRALAALEASRGATGRTLPIIARVSS
ncbi:MAG: glycosyltransferase N-terminal domain-containing protein [Gemmatimonadales bacterium]